MAVGWNQKRHKITKKVENQETTGMSRVNKLYEIGCMICDERRTDTKSDGKIWVTGISVLFLRCQPFPVF